MSAFPDTPATRLTEKVMARVKSRFPEMNTANYNRTYTAVWEAITEEFQQPSGSPGLSRKEFLQSLQPKR